MKEPKDDFVLVERGAIKVLTKEFERCYTDIERLWKIIKDLKRRNEINKTHIGSDKSPLW